MELYVGVIPLAAFALLLVAALSSASLSAELYRLVLLTACLGACMLATVAALSASVYGLGRTHERNLFYLAPFVLIAFFAWLDAGLPRPRGKATVVAVVLVLLPLAIPVSALSSSGEDGLALVFWEDRGTPPRHAIAEMVFVAATAAAVFLLSRRRAAMIGTCLVALAVALVAGERHAVHIVEAQRSIWRDAGWIDRAVGPEARVVAVWGTAKGDRHYARIEELWADEFFNRSVGDVASAVGPLPDGLPIERLEVRSDGCLAALFPWTPQYAVAEASRPLAAPVVRISPSKQRILYRLGASATDRQCFARLQRG
jgi:hypothetical protein